MFPVILALGKRIPGVGDVLSIFDNNKDSTGDGDKGNYRKYKKRQSDDYDPDDSSQF